MTVELLRDTSTVGHAMPDARTGLWRLGLQFGAVLNVLTARRFAIVVCKEGISIFATDMTTMARVDSGQSNRKGTLPVSCGYIWEPLTRLRIEDVVGACLSADETMLYVFSGKGVHGVDLTLSCDMQVDRLYHSDNISDGLVIDTKMFLLHDNKAVVTSVENKNRVSAQWKDVIPMDTSNKGKKEWRIAKRDNLVCLSFGSDKIYLLDVSTNVTYTGAISGGAVLRVGVLKGEWVEGLSYSTCVYVHQKDVVSIYILNDVEKELDLCFQLRDGISRVQFDSVDVSENGNMLIVSSEAMTGRTTLELFDLSGIRPKSASLVPIMKYDISRLVFDSGYKLGGVGLARFIKNDGEDDFVLFVPDDTGKNIVGMIWEAVQRDQWFAYMPNFQVLNKNMVYVESEEEFDFNQNENDMNIVRSTISRYKSFGSKRMSFVDDAMSDSNRKPSSKDDVSMQSDNANDFPSHEPLFPFLQPVTSWNERTTKSVLPIASSITSPASAEFFSPDASKVLLNSIEYS